MTTNFLAGMRAVAIQLHTKAPDKRDAAVHDMRNAVAQHFMGTGELPAAAALALFITTAAQAIGDMLLQVPPGHVSQADLIQLVADELRRATDRQGQTMNGHAGLIIGGTG